MMRYRMQLAFKTPSVVFIGIAQGNIRVICILHMF